jgi:hypothetical protein
MNKGKTHAFFKWAYNGAFVPPPSLPSSSSSSSSPSSYSPSDDFEPEYDAPTNFTRVLLAPHDPRSSRGLNWVRPDYVVKADDDSFVMLGELEARLRMTPRQMLYWGCMWLSCLPSTHVPYLHFRSHRPQGALYSGADLCTLIRPCAVHRHHQATSQHDRRS